MKNSKGLAVSIRNVDLLVNKNKSNLANFHRKTEPQSVFYGFTKDAREQLEEVSLKFSSQNPSSSTPSKPNTLTDSFCPQFLTKLS